MASASVGLCHPYGWQNCNDDQRAGAGATKRPAMTVRALAEPPIGVAQIKITDFVFPKCDLSLVHACD
jgi:hypothetical protein